MSMGLQGAGALQALQALLRQREIDAQKLGQQGFENANVLRDDARADTALNQQGELARAQMEALRSDREGLAEDRRLNRGIQLNDAIPAGSEIAPTSEALPYLRSAGADLTHDTGALASTQMTGATTLPGGPAPIRGSLRMIQQPAKAEHYIKGQSARQAATQVDDQRAAAAEARAGRAQTSTEAHQRAMETIAAQNAGSAAQNRDLTGQLNELRIQAERDKLNTARTERTRATDNAASTTQTALDLVDRLEKHPGLGWAYGNISSRTADLSQEATDAGAIRDQLVAALALPNLGALKGPMSDKDILFIKQVSTRLSNSRISETEARKAIADAKVFLQSKVSGGGVQAPSLPNGIRIISVEEVP